MGWEAKMKIKQLLSLNPESVAIYLNIQVRATLNHLYWGGGGGRILLAG